MRPKDADRLAALDEERLVLAQLEERADDRPQRLVAPGRLPGAAVDDELLGPLCDLRVEVVQEHPKRRLRGPRAGVELRAPRRTNA